MGFASLKSSSIVVLAGSTGELVTLASIDGAVGGGAVVEGARLRAAWQPGRIYGCVQASTAGGRARVDIISVWVR